MKVLVVGATGATGRHVVTQLLNRGAEVTAIVRSTNKLTPHENLTQIKASVHSLTRSEMAEHVKDCDAAVSCLGHNLTAKGIFGKPRLLVTETLQTICEAIQLNKPATPVKVVLMNSSGNSNRDISEVVQTSQRIATVLMRALLPPHRDNENAADYLRTQNNSCVEWVAVRPDGLIDEDKVTEYTVFASPIRNPITNAGKTSRINAANFMVELILDDSKWRKWQGQMPVVYNKEWATL